MAILPGEHRLAGFIGAKDDRSGDNCSYMSCKSSVISSPSTNQTNTQFFYKVDTGYPSCHSTNSDNLVQFSFHSHFNSVQRNWNDIENPESDQDSEFRDEAQNTESRKCRLVFINSLIFQIIIDNKVVYTTALIIIINNKVGYTTALPSKVCLACVMTSVHSWVTISVMETKLTKRQSQS